ncbi:uncharacterized protein MYCGRDRAFT_91242 [Zymoseptoria tritici IPO323]|uniref:Phosphoglycerate mutase-like protein n=1 Tax=Zymoseptoria tritici (strain CBS 115943 / IPO323) TaxID=336722 RepID=F9X4U9_ZYMTI|nr:uncharacterized protein MYCGRDRAFT_91242 [Zymoseptoria tritici IPO323]EGP90235.1 hypothetical protein MYCGRDRAFT_91242 [Zymoseptoria tritici IPO323]
MKLSLLGSTALAVSATHVASITVDNKPGYIKYTTVKGYFLQDEPSTNATTFNYVCQVFRNLDIADNRQPTTNFGLINRTYPATEGLCANLTQWQLFSRQVDALNAAAPLNTVYKTIFMGRHGEGYHNSAESYYGTPAWNCYWAQLTGNGSATWEDAKLTSPGVLQAQIAHNFWKHQIKVQKIPYPQSLTEVDQLWNGVTAEDDTAHKKRMLALLDDVFTNDDHTWISFTSHTGTIATLLSVLGHQPFRLSTGAVIPVLIKAEFLPASDALKVEDGAFTTSTWCHNGPPITSLKDVEQGCVCSKTTAALPSLMTQAPGPPGQTAPLNEYTKTTEVEGNSVSTSNVPCEEPTDY